MANIPCSGYHPGGSKIHAATTQSKIFLALILMLASGTGNGLILLAIALLCHLGLFISGISISDAWKRLGKLKVFLLVLGGTPLFYTPGTAVQLFDGFSLPMTREGFECGVFTVTRLVLMIWISMILVWTTSPESFIKMVSGLRVFPECKVFQEFVLVGMLAFQTLPYLIAEAEEEMVRGWERQGKLKTRVCLFETIKEMVRSLIMWTVVVLAEPDRLIGRQRKP